jgi:UPF0042 nucleotide-binding protein
MAAGLAVAAFRSGPVPGPVAVAVGCAGGRHRAAAIAIAIGELLDGWGIPADVVHRDIARPVIERAGHPAARNENARFEEGG